MSVMTLPDTTALKALAAEWLIRKGGYFYRPNKQGYTTSKGEAGRYTEADAKDEASVEPWHMKAIHQDEVPDEPNVAACMATVERLTADLERVTTQATHLQSIVDGLPNNRRPFNDVLADRTIVEQVKTIDGLRGDLAAVRAERDEMIRLNAPDASPDDPAVTRLTVDNTVREWMRCGYRLHQRVGIDKCLANLTASATAAEADVARLREALAPFLSIRDAVPVQDSVKLIAKRFDDLAPIRVTVTAGQYRAAMDAARPSALATQGGDNG